MSSMDVWPCAGVVEAVLDALATLTRLEEGREACVLAGEGIVNDITVSLCGAMHARHQDLQKGVVLTQWAAVQARWTRCRRPRRGTGSGSGGSASARQSCL